ncbi:MAG TPA: hypothetical protein VFU96_02270 [Acidimicrobiia bacterium]|nr:hypothetical protein [Acidimicrobiia bacterium]
MDDETMIGLGDFDSGDPNDEPGNPDEDEEMRPHKRWAVCPRCHGNGSHVNPSIDGNGITESEMAELGEDFREDYMSGVFDVPCEECGGLRVVPGCHCGQPVVAGHWYPGEIDEPEPYTLCHEHLEGEQLSQWRAMAELAAEQAAERRARC